MQKDPEAVLKKYWGHTAFKGSQEKVIRAVLAGRDVIALLPTGGGKSVCYQVPTLVNPGLCIVVSPLVALIQDQVSALKKKGIPAIALTGGIAPEALDRLLDNCIYGKVKFLYLSPERLAQSLVQARIRNMNVQLIAIDEAHCISEWGHDFRPAYRKCALLRELQPEVPVIALSATATQPVIEDISENLQLSEPMLARDSFLRKNIAFSVRRNEDKRFQLEQLLHEETNSAIIYVRRRRDTESISNFLNAKGKTATFFHGGLFQHEKKEKLQDWLANKVQVMVATNAFGMGVDKPDVGLVVHYQIPESIENYYQEAGRAGRNGQPAKAVLLVHPSDVERAKGQFLEALPDTPFVKMVYKKLCNYFQIAYGELPPDSFGLDFDKFCHTYDLPALKTWSALRLLDQNAVLALSQFPGRTTTLRVVAHKEALFNWLHKHKTKATIIQTVLRTYGGLFDFDTKINLAVIAKKASVKEQLVIQALEELQQDGLAIYTANQEDLEMTFLVPREDDITINLISKHIELLNKTKKSKLNSMLGYVANTTTCRANYLLEYFGEVREEVCGQCDITRTTDRTSNKLSTESAILKLLANKEMTSRALSKALMINEEILLNSLQKLLEDNKLEIRERNTYGVTKR